MTINSEGFITWATRIDGIPDKIYTERNTGNWITCHSIVGYEPETQDGIPNRFLSTEKYWDAENGYYRYTPDAAASSMFVLRYSGELIQMYPVWASTWTSGGRIPNTNSWAIEAEGGYIGNTREPLRPAQVETFVRLVEEWEAYKNKVAVPNVNIYQHKDMARLYGVAATSCASDRYDNAWKVISEREKEMTPEQVKILAREVILNEDLETDYRLRQIMQMRTEIAELAFSTRTTGGKLTVEVAHQALKNAGLIP